MKETDQRKRVRFEINEFVISFETFCNDIGEVKSDVIYFKINDLSYGGINLSTKKELNINDWIYFNLTLKNMEKLSFSAMIRWKKNNLNAYIYGLSFENMTKDQIYFLKSYIEEKNITA